VTGDFRLSQRLVQKLGPVILPEEEWDNKEGEKQKGFEHFQDYCEQILKRKKSAVYHMLSLDGNSNRNPPAHPLWSQ
jgi:hypothetical protein